LANAYSNTKIRPKKSNTEQNGHTPHITQLGGTKNGSEVNIDDTGLMF
jgi:hypothetical protein